MKRPIIAALVAISMGATGCGTSVDEAGDGSDIRNYAASTKPENPLRPDGEFQFSFQTTEEARSAFGAALFETLEAAGINYDPVRRQFVREARVYAPEYLIDRDGIRQAVVRYAETEGGRVINSEAGSTTLALVRTEVSGSSTNIDIGPFDSNGFGSSGSLRVLARSGDVTVFEKSVGWATQGYVGSYGEAFVIGKRGLLPPLIPLFATEGDSGGVEGQGADLGPPEGLVRLDGDKLIVNYDTGQAVYRIGSAGLELIQGDVPAELKNR